MKKITSIILVLVLSFLCSCGAGNTSSKDESGVSTHGIMSEASIDTSKDTPTESTDESKDTSTENMDESKDTSTESTDISEDASLSEKTIDLMSSFKRDKVLVSTDFKMEEGNEAYNTFAIELIKKAVSTEENVLVSPLSAIYALGLTANGADGNTLVQMESVFGISVSKLNQYLYYYAEQKAAKEATELSIANSIWFSDSFAPKNEFLQTNADYYAAAAYKADFDDINTVSDINNWVKDKTKGMIPKIIEEIDDSTVMFLINALAFEAEWRDQYEETAVREGDFTTANGEKVKVDFMYSDNEIYIHDENADGFIKYYNGNYAFAALLPNENLSIEEYVSTLSGEKITKLLNEKSTMNTVDTALPKFETSFDVEMRRILSSMGMTDAFIPGVANLTKTGEAPNLHIGSVIQKTFISVGELGTKAGAVTAVIENAESCPPQAIKEVYLNRPFVYMLIDTTTNTPFFIGTMLNPIA